MFVCVEEDVWGVRSMGILLMRRGFQRFSRIVRGGYYRNGEESPGSISDVLFLIGTNHFL